MTGLIHDPEFFSRHNRSDHAENAGRLALVKEPDGKLRVNCRPATDEELLAVHTSGHLLRVAAASAQGGGMLDSDTYCGPDSESVARSAAGGLVDLCLSVQSGDCDNGLALVRPPGHHATADRAMGFCLYNNVAVAARALQRGGAAKVAIVDIDVHHGNGTQDIFYADDTVFYCSSHQYPHYPGSGAESETGRDAGLGYTLNSPLSAGAGDQEFLSAYRDEIVPALTGYAPDFILISAGFDAHVADPLAGLNVTTAGYAAVIRLLVKTAGEVCGGRIVFALEGGYSPKAVAECVGETVAALMATS